MAIALDIMKGGVSGGMAKALQGQVRATVSAAGTTQSDATDLAASVNVITTATADQGVQIPNVEIADEVEICNISGAQIKGYPPTSGQINDLPANIHMTLADNTAVKLKKFTATRWMGFLSA